MEQKDYCIGRQGVGVCKREGEDHADL
jgi:hypothetical protein